jgi:hypothetical protein
MLVPLYFQISAHATVTNAGAHLMPSVLGNAIGGLLTGLVIRRTGRYKLIAVIGALSSSLLLPNTHPALARTHLLPRITVHKPWGIRQRHSPLRNLHRSHCRSRPLPSRNRELGVVSE